MNGTPHATADLAALSNLIAKGSELRDLDGRMSRFNLFNVVGSAYSEKQHSNILAWLFDPTRHHGLGFRFLKNWLRGVVQTPCSQKANCITPEQIDFWQLEEVKVFTEWAATLEEIEENRRIDLLLVLTMTNAESWVVCIENKVRSSQQNSQLAAYRKIIESKFGDATHKIFVFLTKDGEVPEDPVFIRVTYTMVHQALTEAVSQTTATIDSEPRLVIDHYIRLLHDQFLGGANVTEIALAIYREHKRAIEIIARHAKGVPADGEEEVATSALEIYRHHRTALDLVFHHASQNLWPHAKLPLERLIATDGPSHGILPGPIDKKPLTRFIPAQWDDPGNHQGTGWKTSPYQILFELDLSAVPPNLLIVCHAPPADWDRKVRRLLEDICFTPPPGSKTSKNWPRYFLQKCDIPSEFELLVDPARAAATLFEWIATYLAQPRTRQIIQLIADELPDLVSSSLPPQT